MRGDAKQFGQYFPILCALVSVNYHPNSSLEALFLALREEKMMKNFGLQLSVFHCLTQVRDASSQGWQGKLMNPFRILLESMTQSHNTGSGALNSSPLSVRLEKVKKNCFCLCEISMFSKLPCSEGREAGHGSGL